MYIISDECISCGACRATCPAEAIHPGDSGHMEIDQSKCVQCGTCFDGCPMEAIEES